ncbi:MAG: Rrf2 family transcriptional regulator [Dehalococcoidia bacterium]|nr:Rrf2 family transcriptional regulator [Dehalococcoidia bacterium]
MKISMKSDYAVRAMTDLALHLGEGPVQSADIAARQGIPEPYLDQLLTILRKAGLIRSIRGPQGGHILARPAEEIKLSEVIVVLEGSFAPMYCVDEATSCERSGTCVQREIWKSVKEATQELLQSTTIHDLAQRELRQQSRVMYHI